MFDHKHYVPILKSKAGERWALGNLFSTTRSRITPLLELHEHKAKSAKEHLPVLCDDLLSVWGTDKPFFLDTIWLHGTSGSASIIKTAFESARQCGLKAIPAVHLAYGSSARNEIRAIVAKDKRGYLLRVHSSDAGDLRAIDSTLNALGLPPKSVDFLIDYQAEPMDLAADVANFPRLRDWRTLIAASGAFPKAFSSFHAQRWHKVDRADFNSWEAGVTTASLGRKPAFADFACRDPGAPADFGEPSVNARYAKERHWLFWIGRKVKHGGSADMHQLCADLVGRPDYSGARFSAGDSAIWDTAYGILGPGNATQWVQWHVNHHIEFTVQQLSSHPLL